MNKHERRNLLKKAKLEMRQDKEYKELIRKTAMDAFTRIHEELKLYRKQKEVNFVGYATHTMSWWRHPIRHVYMEPPRWVSIRDEIRERYCTESVHSMFIRGGRRMINPVEEARAIQGGIEEIDEEFRRYGKCLRAKIRHTRLLRSELMEAVRRQNCIWACHAIKEELIASMWHPRRVERWLAQGHESYLFDE